MLPLKFIPLYFPEKLMMVNPYGWVGVVTLWSHPSVVYKKMESIGVNLSSNTSPIALLGTLYGNGLPELLRNLLYNPQITHLVIVGKDRSGSKKELVNFFEKGIEEVIFLGRKLYRIKGTNRLMDGILRPDEFTQKPKILIFDEDYDALKNAISQISPPEKFGVRKKIPLPSTTISHFPSNPRNHNVVAKDPLSAWLELIFRIVRFGRVVHLKKGDRQELQNVRVVVENPSFISDENLVKFGFDPASFMEYYNHFLDSYLPDDTQYTYGNRLTAYFGRNLIEDVVENLRKDPEDRKSYITLWDSSRDLTSPSGHPCLVSLFFRKFEDKLTVTATFRTHNALDAWLKNFYGVMRVQDEVTKKVNMEKGPITIISHSISVDPNRYTYAQSIATQKKYEVKEDPCGNFVISVENGEIVVKQYWHGIVVGEYKSKKASVIQHQLYRDCAISDINHALYIGRMLQKAEYCLKTSTPFVQE